jgi:transcriptional regulator with XRE-family HTH domain
MSENSDIYLYSDKSIMQQIGKFVKQQRISKSLTQQELADKAAISRSTLSLMERGENIVLLNLVKVLRILDELHVFKAFNTPLLISPFLLAEAEQKQRKRVRNNKDLPNPPSDFVW